jgi:hypothetical protein
MKAYALILANFRDISGCERDGRVQRVAPRHGSGVSLFVKELDRDCLLFPDIPLYSGDSEESFPLSKSLTLFWADLSLNRLIF